MCGGGANRPPPVVVFALDGKPLKLGFRNLVTFPNYLLGTLRQNFEFLACAEASPEPVSWGGSFGPGLTVTTFAAKERFT